MAATFTVDIDSLASAVVQWVNTFEGTPVLQVQDLDDPTILYNILREIDGQWFKPMRNLGDFTDGGWVVNYNKFSQLFQLLRSYYEEILGQHTGELELPNLTLIARDADVVQILKLAQLVIALAVQCADNQRYVAKIQLLDQTSQHSLMLAIETVMTRLASAGAGESKSSAEALQGEMDGSIQTALMQEASANKRLTEELAAQRAQYEELADSKRQLEQRLQDMEGTLSQLTEAGQVDFILRTEIDNLKGTLSKTENRRAELEIQVEQQSSAMLDLHRKLEESAAKAQEADRLKDALDEFRHMADKLQKSEAIIDKYKKRLDEVGDLRRQIKAAEDQNQKHIRRNEHLEEEHRKISSLKPLVETMREQLSNLETRNSSLQVENSTLEFQLTEARTKVERLDLEKQSDHEHIQSLEDQLKDLEYSNAGENLAATDEMSPAGESESLFKVKFSQMEREVERLRAEKISAQANVDKMVQLENLLEDANRLKAKYEADYRNAYEKNMALENELTQLHAVAASSPHAAAAAEPTRGAHLEVEQVQKQVKQLAEDLRQSIGKANKAAFERDRLHAELADAQQNMNAHERLISELRGDLAAMESRGQSSDESVQKLAAITKQAVDAQSKNDTLHTALKQAKEHIRRQDHSLQEYAASAPKDDNFSEAISSLKATVSEREAEIERVRNELMDTRAAARREQKLLASAWWNLTCEAQIKATARLMVQPGEPAPAPKSWLQRERQRLDHNGLRR
ncbi:hypothetical protein HKX48_000849 [Thoreauomyces humboldtii]|nr:hypothetical protein HKX48_000849 [Thoreauomyces humboldtii]